jgi:CAAX protease family protein
MFARIFLKDGRLRPALRVLVYMAAALGAQVALAIPVAIGYQLAYGPRAMYMRTPLWLDELLNAIAVVGAAFVLRIFLDRRSVASLGLTLRTRWLQLFAIGVAFGGCLQLAVFAIELALHNTRVLDIAAGSWRNTLVWAAIFLFAALAEEMPLRGYILQNLWEEAGFWPAAIITSVAFAWLHAKNPYFGQLPWMTVLNIAVDGVWACLAVLWTRSLWLAWGAHFSWNLFEGPILGTPVSGIQTGSSIVTQAVTGPSAITGDGFGPEAGVVVLVVQIAAIGALYALYRLGVFAHLPDTREAYAQAAAGTK